LYATFYQLVASGVRPPQATQTDLDRLLADDLLFPYYKEKIRFGALSLDRKGVAHYGGASIVLKDTSIENRATVFEENSLRFAQVRGFSPIPAGYRATWHNRQELAAAKLESKLRPGMDSGAFSAVLMEQGSATMEPDFIEVHIYGSLHRQSIEAVTLPSPQDIERPLLLNLQKQLAKLGIEVLSSL
jgi:hypothetical protein